MTYFEEAVFFFRGGRSVGMVRLRTEITKFLFCFVMKFKQNVQSKLKKSSHNIFLCVMLVWQNKRNREGFPEMGVRAVAQPLILLLQLQED